MNKRFYFLLTMVLFSILLIGCENKEKVEDIKDKEVNIVLGEPEGIYLDENGLLVNDNFLTKDIIVEKNITIDNFIKANEKFNSDFVRFEASENTEIINFNNFDKTVTFSFIDGVLKNVSYISYIKDDIELEAFENDMNKVIVKENLNEGNNYKQYSWTDEKTKLNFSYVINTIDKEAINKQIESTLEENNKLNNTEKSSDSETSIDSEISDESEKPNVFNTTDYSYVVLYSVFYDNFPIVETEK